MKTIYEHYPFSPSPYSSDFNFQLSDEPRKTNTHLKASFP